MVLSTALHPFLLLLSWPLPVFLHASSFLFPLPRAPSPFLVWVPFPLLLCAGQARHRAGPSRANQGGPQSVQLHTRQSFMQSSVAPLSSVPPSLLFSAQAQARRRAAQQKFRDDAEVGASSEGGGRTTRRRRTRRRRKAGEGEAGVGGAGIAAGARGGRGEGVVGPGNTRRKRRTKRKRRMRTEGRQSAPGPGVAPGAEARGAPAGGPRQKPAEKRKVCAQGWQGQALGTGVGCRVSRP